MLIKFIIKKKIISGFRISIDYDALSLLFYKALVYIDNPDEKRIKELEDYFHFNKNIIHNVKVLGNWDYEPEFEIKNAEELNQAITEIKDKFSDIISKIDLITIDKEHKFVYF